jgi:hypothetical protein
MACAAHATYIEERDPLVDPPGSPTMPGCD